MAATASKTETDFLVYSHTVGLRTVLGRGFLYPSDTAIGHDGMVYTVNRSNEVDIRDGVRVTVYELNGEFSHVFSGGGEAEGQLLWPTAIEIDSRDRVYVSDDDTNLISVFETSGEFLFRWGELGAGEGQLDGPSGMAFDSEDNLYVVDHANNRVQKFTAEGEFLSAFGSEGSGDGEFNLPWGITIDSHGDIFVADWRNDRVQKLSPDGKFIASYGAPGDGDGEFRRPSGVAVDAEGHIYVSDWGNERVQVLGPDGSFLAKYRGEATNSIWADEYMASNVEEAEARARADMEPEIDYFEDTPHEESSHIEKLFWAPTAVTLDAEGRLYVTESNRQRVQVYERGRRA
jgi:DNA-binding beta-propeller fold protein YncE